MDRQTDYAFQEAYETDFLYAQRFSYEGLGLLAMDLLGVTTLVAGLGCVPTGPASLQVKMQPGRIYSVQNLEPTAWGVFAAIGGLAADTNTDHNILKQGLYRDTTTLATMAAPGTGGQSINYLIEASFSEVDANPISLPFVSSTPPYPAVAPNTLNTVRQDKVVITVKAGVAAATGSQVTPSVDASNVGLWVVTVANGQTQILAGNIVAYAGAPFLTETLTQKISQTTGDARYLQKVNARTQLAANTTFYVRSDGNDANTGLANTAGGAFLTVQKAADVLANLYDFNGFQVSINIGTNATYAGATFYPCVGQRSPILFTGLSTASTIFNTALNVAQSAYVQFSTLKCAGGANGITSAGQAIIGAGVEFGALVGGTSAHLYSTGFGSISIINSYTISGGAGSHYQEFGGTIAIAGGITVTLTGTPAFASSFARASQQGQITFVTSGGIAVFSGAATGQRYTGDNLGLISTSGQGASYIPGNSAGTVTNNAVYS